jgi:hypothetical protein
MLLTWGMMTMMVQAGVMMLSQQQQGRRHSAGSCWHSSPQKQPNSSSSSSGVLAKPQQQRVERVSLVCSAVTRLLTQPGGWQQLWQTSACLLNPQGQEQQQQDLHQLLLPSLPRPLHLSQQHRRQLLLLLLVVVAAQ